MSGLFPTPVSPKMTTFNIGTCNLRVMTLATAPALELIEMQRTSRQGERRVGLSSEETCR